MKRTLVALALVAAVLAPAAEAACFTVFQKSLIVYRSELTPIDLSGPIHEGLQRRFPGGLLVISDDVRSCTFIDPASPVDPQTGAAASTPGSPPAVVSVVPGPLANMQANVAGAGAVDSAQGGSVDEGCRRGGTVTRRGEPCPETVVGQRVVGAQQDPAAPVGAEERRAVRRAR